MQKFGILGSNKTCRSCREEKPLTAEFFHKRKDSKDGFRNDCRVCNVARINKWAKENRDKTRKYKQKWSEENREQNLEIQREYRENNREKQREYARKYKEKNPNAKRNSTYKRKYGITLAEYDVMFEDQNGTCSICKLPEINRRLAVDHDHKTGKVRSLLCTRCNMVIGLMEENTESLNNAIKYIERHKDAEVCNTFE